MSRSYWRLWACGRVFTICVTGWMSFACSHPKPGTIAALVQRAKSEGRAFVYLPADTFEPAEGSLADLTKTHSLMMTSPVRIAAAQSVEGNNIYTWSVFRVIEILSRKHNARRSECSLKMPPSISLQLGEVARPTVGGTMVIRGVSVVQRQSNWSPSSGGGRYVTGVTFCEGSVAMFPAFGGDVFEVTASDTLRAAIRWPSLFQYQREMESLGTLDGLRKYLQKHSASR